MPRKPIDYSNTIIYKLCCNDPNITDVYVGSTTNWTNRKNEHKSNCNNENSEKYNLQVYTFIRDNGDWNNWSMIEIEKICCIDKLDAKKNERRHIELLGATLNSNIPSRTPQEYYKENKEVITEKKKEYSKQYRKNNIEKEQQRHKKYNEENKEKIKVKRRKTYENTIEKVQEQSKKYYEENIEKVRARHKKYYYENIEKERERKRKYRELQNQIKLETERLFDIDI